MPPIFPLRNSVKSGFGRPAASVYAVCMSRTAAVNLVGFFMLHGAGPAASTETTIPVTSVQVKRSAAPVIGLVPTSPVTAEVGTSVIPDFVRITKSPADLRFTGAGPGPAANALPHAASRNAVDHIRRFVIVLTVILFVSIQNSYEDPVLCFHSRSRRRSCQSAPS